MNMQQGMGQLVLVSIVGIIIVLGGVFYWSNSSVFKHEGTMVEDDAMMVEAGEVMKGAGDTVAEEGDSMMEGDVMMEEKTY